MVEHPEPGLVIAMARSVGSNLYSYILFVLQAIATVLVFEKSQFDEIVKFNLVGIQL